MKADSIGSAAELVLELTSPAPSAAFSLFQRQPDGSVREYPLRVRLLREEESIAALKAAQEYAKSLGELDRGYGDIYKEAQACELMARALCRTDIEKLPSGVEYYPRLFTESKQLRSSFTENEIAVCLNAYEVVKARYRCFEEWKPEQLEQWAERLSSALGPLDLSRLDSALWPDLIWGLSRRVVELLAQVGHPPSTSPNSSGSPPDGSDSGTGGSTQSPYVVSSDGSKLPDDHLITKAEADEIAKKMRESE